MSSYPVPDSIPSGLGGDQSQALHDWLVSLETGATAIINAEYQTDQTLEFVNVQGLTVQFTPAGQFTRKNDVIAAPQIVLTHCSSFNWIDATIEGTKPSGATYDATREQETAFRFLASDHCTITRPRTFKIWGDHFYFGKPNRDPVWSSYIEVLDGDCGTSGRDAIAMTSADHCAVRRTQFLHGRTCIDLEPNGAQGGVTKAVVEDCTFSAWENSLLFLAAQNSSTVGLISDVTVQRNTVANGSLQSTVAGGSLRQNFTVTDNRGSLPLGNPRGAVMWFGNLTGSLTVTGNSNPFEKGRHMHMAKWDDYTASHASITYNANVPADQA